MLQRRSASCYFLNLYTKTWIRLEDTGLKNPLERVTYSAVSSDVIAKRLRRVTTLFRVA
jgi:hypothetical protein